VRKLDVLRAGVALLALTLFHAPTATAASTTYDLVTGELTAVFVDGFDVLEGNVVLDDATLTADFLDLDLENLYISATGPGIINLSPTQSISFSNASLQSIGVSDLTINGGFYNFGTNALVAADLTNGSGTTRLQASSGVTGSIALAEDGLIVTLEGVVFPSLGEQLVKADFSFTARNLGGGETAIPEPGSQLLFPAGLALLGWVLRRK
jgi:hypothetical protein